MQEDMSEEIRGQSEKISLWQALHREAQAVGQLFLPGRSIREPARCIPMLFPPQPWLGSWQLPTQLLETWQLTLLPSHAAAPLLPGLALVSVGVSSEC